MWTVPNVAINPGEDAVGVLKAHRDEFLRNTEFDTPAEKSAALAAFDQIAAGLPALIKDIKFTVTFSMSGEGEGV